MDHLALDTAAEAVLFMVLVLAPEEPEGLADLPMLAISPVEDLES